MALKTPPVVRLDDSGYPLPAEDASTLTAGRHPVICVNCLDTSGAASVTLTKKRGFAVHLCPICRTCAYANSPQAHDLFRRWQIVLSDPALRRALLERLAAIP
jgi:hypothetical protein